MRQKSFRYTLLYGFGLKESKNMTRCRDHFVMGWFREFLRKKHPLACLFAFILILGNCCGVYGNEEIITKARESEVINDAAKYPGQVQRIRRFWVVRPCAIEWSKDNPETGEMFVGYATQWYHFLVPDRIKRVGWNDWVIPEITRFGVIKNKVIYGEMKNEKWFIAKPGDDSLPVFFNNKDTWLQKLTELGVTNTPEMVTISEGYHDAQQSLWIGRVAWGGIIAGIVSLPWMIARYLRLQKNRKKKRSKLSSG